MEHIYDILIVGGGPGGYTAALYGARAGLDTALVEKLSAGGQMALTEQIDNYPGFPEGIDGFTLGENMKKQAERFGAESVYGEVIRAELSGAVKKVYTADGVLSARSVIVAAGAVPKKLGLPGEEALTGRGVGYCATCDGMFYRGKDVAVAGGGETAVADALFLSRICRRVYVIHRRDSLRASKASQEALFQMENVEMIWDSTVAELHSKDGRLSGLSIYNKKTGGTSELSCQGLFVAIGQAPASGPFAGELSTDEGGYLKAGEDTKTNLPGVFAVGDIRTKAVRQVVTAVADGASAVHYAEEYLNGK